MPIPFLLIGAGLAAVGAGSGAYGAVKMKKANNTFKTASQNYNDAKDTYDKQERMTIACIDKLGKAELDVQRSFSEFVEIIEKIDGRTPQFKEILQTEGKISVLNIDELKKVSVGATVLWEGLKSAAAGVAGAFAIDGAAHAALIAAMTEAAGTPIVHLTTHASYTALTSTLSAISSAGGGAAFIAGGGVLSTGGIIASGGIASGATITSGTAIVGSGAITVGSIGTGGAVLASSSAITAGSLGGGFAAGSSIAAGGAAIGTTVLGASTLGIGVLIGGVIFGVSGKKLKDKADTAGKQSERAVKQFSEGETYLADLEKLSRKFYLAFAKTDLLYRKLLSKLKDISMVKQSINDFSEEEKRVLFNTSALVGLLYQMCKIEMVNKAENDLKKKLNVHVVEAAVSEMTSTTDAHK